jgi:hypothetical protein
MRLYLGSLSLMTVLFIAFGPGIVSGAGATECTLENCQMRPECSCPTEVSGTVGSDGSVETSSGKLPQKSVSDSRIKSLKPGTKVKLKQVGKGKYKLAP